MRFAEPQVHMRSKCPFCRNAELEALAAQLGQPHTPVECKKCHGDGWIYRWAPVSQLVIILNVTQNQNSPSHTLSGPTAGGNAYGGAVERQHSAG